MPPAQGEKKTLVHNLSSLDLTTQEEKVLGYGLSFVPTPRYNAFKTRVDMFKLVCLLKLRSFFGERECAGTNALRSRSTFVPNISDHAIQTFEKVVLRDISQLEKQHSRSFYNLTQQERQLLSNLAKNKEVVIKPADKGGRLVLLDKKDYTFEVYRQLGDESFYQQLRADPTLRFYNILKVISQEGLCLDYIDLNLMKFLL